MIGLWRLGLKSAVRHFEDLRVRAGKGCAVGDDSGNMGPGGPRGGMGGMFNSPTTDRKYNLSISMSGRNLLNHTNPGPIIGDITSPLFGQANSMAGGFGAFSENANNRGWNCR